MTRLQASISHALKTATPIPGGEEQSSSRCSESPLGGPIRYTARVPALAVGLGALEVPLEGLLPDSEIPAESEHLLKSMGGVTFTAGVESQK